MTVCVARYKNQRTYSEKIGESSDFLNFAICVYPRDEITDLQKNQDHMNFVGPCFVHTSSMTFLAHLSRRLMMSL